MGLARSATATLRRWVVVRTVEPDGNGPMLLIWIAASCVLAGVVLTAIPPIWKGRLSRNPSPLKRHDTLEPRRPGRGLGLSSTWPGLGLIAFGVVLFLLAAAT